MPEPLNETPLDRLASHMKTLFSVENAMGNDAMADMFSELYRLLKNYPDALREARSQGWDGAADALRAYHTQGFSERFANQLEDDNPYRKDHDG